MPELPEVEVLVRHLRPLLRNRFIRSVRINRLKVIRPHTTRFLRQALVGYAFRTLHRRGKYLVFTLRDRQRAGSVTLLGHLGMTGRMYLQSRVTPLPRHTAVALDLGSTTFVFEDTRCFGRLTLNPELLDKLGPEPLSTKFTITQFAFALKNSRQPVKIKLLDQTVVAGVGNIYASEALFHARIDPRLAAGKLSPAQIRSLFTAIRHVLRHAIRRGSTIPLDWAGAGLRDGLFYFGGTEPHSNRRQEQLRVYDRAGRPCASCRTLVHRIVQANRSTYFCPTCQC